MFKHTQIQRLMFLFAIAGLLAITADFACLENVCAEEQSAAFTSRDQVLQHRIETLDQALARSGLGLDDSQRTALAANGQLPAALKLDRPVKLSNGTVVMPKGWLPEIPAGHPWGQK